MNGILKAPITLKMDRFNAIKKKWPIWPILLVLGMVLVTTWLNQKHLGKLQDTTITSYENKLTNQHYVYELTRLFSLKRLSLGVDGQLSDTDLANERIEELITLHGESKLMLGEQLYLNKLIQDYSKLLKLEKSYFNGDAFIMEDGYDQMGAILDQIMLNMDAWENTLVMNGSRFFETSEKSIYLNKLLLNMEITFLIVLGIILQIIFFYPKKVA